MPVKLGGLGLRAAADIALPAYLSSTAASSALVSSILSAEAQTFAKTKREEWDGTGLEEPTKLERQSEWDKIRCRHTIDDVLSRADQHRRACIMSAAAPASGAWLNAVPSSSTGTLLDDESTRISIALRLGLPVCSPHTCRCGARIDQLGLHPLSCSRSSGRLPRHHGLNDVVKRALEAAGYPSVLEPTGLSRNDGKRPDGVTLFPFTRGKSLVWDATCVDTFAQTNLIRCATETGAAAADAETRKLSKYSCLADRYIIQPVAVETSGVCGPSTLAFLRMLGRRAGELRNEHRETKWLMNASRWPSFEEMQLPF